MNRVVPTTIVLSTSILVYQFNKSTCDPAVSKIVSEVLDLDKEVIDAMTKLDSAKQDGTVTATFDSDEVSAECCRQFVGKTEYQMYLTTYYSTEKYASSKFRDYNIDMSIDCEMISVFPDVEPEKTQPCDPGMFQTLNCVVTYEMKRRNP